MQAILNDATLRRGDVVAFPDGPKVFAGHGSYGPWQLTDFEGIAGSKAVSSKTKAAVLALAPPVIPAEMLGRYPQSASLQ